MSYHMMGSRPSYDSIPNGYGNQVPPPFGSHNMFQQPQQSTSVALFHIPNDATNSLYVDGIPNDASEREVSRNIGLI